MRSEAQPSLVHPILAALLLTVTTATAFRPAYAGTDGFWLLVSGPTLALSLYASGVLKRAGKLRALLLPRPGDLTLGAVLGALLLALSWGVRDLSMSAGEATQTWLYLLFVQLGDPRQVQESVLLTLLILSVVFGEELLFRGWIQERLNERWGEQRGWWIQALWFTFTLLPTAFGLRGPEGPPNPLLILAGLGCALCFGLCRRLTGRLLPGFFAHAVFSYFSVAQFRSPGL